MSVECFIDSNVIIYAASAAAEDASKRVRARALLSASRFGISAQVLQEVFVTVTRKARAPIPSRLALTWIENFAVVPCVAVDYALVRTAISISGRFRISYWDAAIIAAAEELGAKTLYTEDLSHGQAYGSVTAINPFRGL